MKLPRGFRYATTYAGIRKVAKDDLALIVSDTPASAAAVFTQNQVVAAPVVLARENLAKSRGRIRAWVINAGNANCATRTGEKVARECVDAAARALGVERYEVLPASTGVIGVEMDGSKITNALPALARDLRTDAFDAVAKAIMTTDTVPKTALATVGRVRFAGVTKGAGMIHPNMATTLCFIMTDGVATPAEIRAALKKAVAVTFNRLTVDGDTSTNDTLGVMANGASGIKLNAAELAQGLTKVMESLAKQIAADGEGAKKLITIDIEGATTQRAAELMGRAIANSPLVKTAVAGSDPNWGRVLAAAGYSGAKFNPREADVYMQGTRVCQNGLATRIDEEKLSKKLDAPECHIRVVFKGGGRASARFWTCDFTEDYIRINAEYRT